MPYSTCDAQCAFARPFLSLFRFCRPHQRKNTPGGVPKAHCTLTPDPHLGNLSVSQHRLRRSFFRGGPLPHYANAKRRNAEDGCELQKVKVLCECRRPPQYALCALKSVTSMRAIATPCFTNVIPALRRVLHDFQSKSHTLWHSQAHYKARVRMRKCYSTLAVPLRICSITGSACDAMSGMRSFAL